MADKRRGRAVGFGVLIAVLSLPLGYLVLTILQAAIDLLWVYAPSKLPTAGLVVVALAVPTLAGVAVAWLRSGADGHNPMFGIALQPVTGQQYPWVIGAIAATLVGGLVLGPEVAMVSTGAFVGTEIASRSRAMDVTRGATVGALFAILALFVGPSLGGTFSVSPDYTFDWRDLVGSVGVAAVTTGAIALGRFLSIGVLRLHGGDRPRTVVLAAAGFLVGALALGYTLGTGNEISLVLTSGEHEVKPLLALGTAGAIGLTVAIKWLAYSLSMGGGFRGGPFFPAIFIGAGIGAIATTVTPDYANAAAVAGMTAAVIYLAHPTWAVTLALGIVLGLLVGGPELIPLAVAAAAVAKLIPGVRDSTKPTGAQTIKEVR